MRVPDMALNSVCFIGAKLPDGKFAYLGSGSFVAYNQPNAKGLYLVTAKHVVKGFEEKSRDLYVRFNGSQGGVHTFMIDPSDWQYHSDAGVDIAVKEFEWEELADYKMTYLNSYVMATEVAFKGLHVGAGNETVCIGLYTPFSGDDATGLEPIARCGSIASVPKKPREHNGRFGMLGTQEVILVEMRSISGLSGSPVLATLDDKHFEAVGLDLVDLKARGLDKVTVMAIGVISGHWRFEGESEDDDVKKMFKDFEFGTVNTGIAFVTPMYKVREIIESGDIAERAATRKPMPEENQCQY